jgi:ABC-type branched-subunit amino acid transport system ATPase component
VNGINRRVSGAILLHGEDIASLDPARRARKGLGRTFQLAQLAESLSVAENVALGYEAGLAGSDIRHQFAASARAKRDMMRAVSDAMELCGIGALARTQAGSLSTGQRRLVELARCVAGRFDVLLLDEPSSGLDLNETVAFGDVLIRMLADRGCGVLIVEHDMSLVSQICDYVYVLDFGRLIFAGDAQRLMSDAGVQAAYLGEPEVIDARAGEL